MEKRKFTRVMFETRGVLTDGEGRSVEGRVTDLSLQGMFMLCDDPPAQGETLDVRFILGDEAAQLSFELKGTAIRAAEGGVAVMFNLKRVDVDAITHLRHIVSYALGDTESVMDEYYEFLREQMPEI